MIKPFRGGIGLAYSFDSESVKQRGKAEGYLQLPSENPNFIRNMGILTTKMAHVWLREATATDEIQGRKLARFIDPAKIIPVKDEDFKAEVLASWARHEKFRIAIYHDKPYKIGAALLRLALDDKTPPFGTVGIIAAGTYSTYHRSIQDLENLANNKYGERAAVYREDTTDLIIKRPGSIDTPGDMGDRIHITTARAIPYMSAVRLVHAYPL